MKHIEEQPGWVLHDAKYFVEVLREEKVDTEMAAYILAKLRVEYSVTAANFFTYRATRRYFKEIGRGLPSHFFDLATNEDAFECYCGYIAQYLFTL